MNRLILYYKRVLNQKYLYYLVGKSMGVSLGSRLFHNMDLLNPKYASEVSKLLYDKEGHPRVRYSFSDTELDRLTELINSHKLRSKFCIEYWVANKLEVVPEKYIRQFLADRYADCGLDTSKLLTSNRDLFFQYDKEGSSYNSQVRSLLASLILSNGSLDSIRSHIASSDVSNNGEEASQ